jgi:S-disulfanyl-L-cysteine oxidoreductase SoxD
MPCSLSRSLNSLVSLLALVPLAALGQSRNYNVGAPLSQEEIRSFDFMVGRKERNFLRDAEPPRKARTSIAKRCAACHGRNGEGGAVQRLVLGSPGNPGRGPLKIRKVRHSYYPYPTIAWDYINRAMPASKPGSLTLDEVCAVVAFLFYRNGIIQETDVLDAKSLPKIEMPNRNGFVPAVTVWAASSQETQLVLTLIDAVVGDTVRR